MRFFAIVFLGLFLCSACSVDVDFRQEVTYKLPVIYGEFNTNISIIVASEDVRSFLDESGYSEDDFKSVTLEAAYLSLGQDSGNHGLTHMSLGFAKDLSRVDQLHSVEGSSLALGRNYYFSLNEDSLLWYYKHAPFYSVLSVSGSNCSAMSIKLVIEGTVKVALH